jgi:hypothetical protein
VQFPWLIDPHTDEEDDEVALDLASHPLRNDLGHGKIQSIEVLRAGISSDGRLIHQHGNDLAEQR